MCTNCSFYNFTAVNKTSSLGLTYLNGSSFHFANTIKLDYSDVTVNNSVIHATSGILFHDVANLSFCNTIKLSGG